MAGLAKLLKDRKLVCDIDWDMTPEEAVTLYLEWGNNWSHGKNFVRSDKDSSVYFVVNAWERPPVVILVQRNSQEAKELASFPLPEELSNAFLNDIHHNYGVYAPTPPIKKWLSQILDHNPDICEEE